MLVLVCVDTGPRFGHRFRVWAERVAVRVSLLLKADIFAPDVDLRVSRTVGGSLFCKREIGFCKLLFCD